MAKAAIVLCLVAAATAAAGPALAEPAPIDGSGAGLPSIMVRAAAGDRAALHELASRFATGEGGLPRSVPAALRLHSAAARIGLPGTADTLGGLGGAGIRAGSAIASAPEGATPPTAGISVDARAGPAPLSVSFDGAGATSFDGRLEHAWVASDAGAEAIVLGGGVSIEYRFDSPGDYRVVHVVLDGLGRLASERLLVEVSPAVPAAPAPLEPAEGATLALNEPVELAWEADEVAAAFVVEVLAPDGATRFVSDELRRDTLCVQGRCGYRLPLGLPADRGYAWRVSAVTAAGRTVSADAAFDVAPPPALALCAGRVTDVRAVEIPVLPRPQLLAPYLDPAFGARVTRITDSAPGEVNKPAYSTVQAWNADESLLLLYRTTADRSDVGHYLHDGHDYAEIRRLDIVPSDIEEIFWSYIDPDTLYYFPATWGRRGQLVRHTVSTGREEVLHDFSGLCPGQLQPKAGSDVQMHAHDDDLFALRCGAGEAQTMIGYRVSTGEIASAPLGAGTAWSPWYAPNALARGDGLYLGGYRLDDALDPVPPMLDLATPLEHGSLGLTAAGNNALYRVAFGPSPGGCDGGGDAGIGHLIEHDLDAGTCRGIITQAAGYPYPTSGTHVSATAYHQPSWVALSSIGNGRLGFLNGESEAPALLSEIYLANTDEASGEVCRLAHHRSFGKSARSGGYDPYFGEPHVTMSPSGTRLLFGSDWYDSGFVDSYVVDLAPGGD